MKWLFRFNKGAHLWGLTGLLGDKAQEDAMDVSAEQAIGCAILFVIGLILLGGYLVLRALGVVA